MTRALLIIGLLLQPAAAGLCAVPADTCGQEPSACCCDNACGCSVGNDSDPSPAAPHVPQTHTHDLTHLALAPGAGRVVPHIAHSSCVRSVAPSASSVSPCLQSLLCVWLT